MNDALNRIPEIDLYRILCLSIPHKSHLVAKTIGYGKKKFPIKIKKSESKGGRRTTEEFFESGNED